MPVNIPNYSTERPQSAVQPLATMQKAAKDLSERTNGLILGNVSLINPGGANLFRYTFYLVAPSLDDYADPLFYAWHGVSPYPVSILMAGDKQGRNEQECADSQEFEECLNRIFESESTRQRIYSMLDVIDAKK